MRTSHISWLLVALVLALPPAAVIAAPQNGLPVLLRGDYHYVGTENCVDTPFDFSDDDYLIPQGPSVNAVSHVSGTISFDGKGNAVTSGTSMTVNDDPANNPIGFSIFSGNFNCSHEYVMNPDGSFTMLQNECNVVGVKGAPGIAINITGGMARGFIGQHNDTLQTATVEPTRQRMIFDGNPAFVITRLCSSTYTYQRARSN